MPQKRNLDTIFNHSFLYARKLARNFYFKQWAKKPPRCPAFQNEIVIIDRKGWEHIIDAKHRSKMDILGRLFCLERARHILETSDKFQNYQKNKGVEYWIFEKVVVGTRVRVVVRSIKKGDKHFYSVIRKGSVDADIRRQ